MNAVDVVPDESIAMRAEFERWAGVRENARRRLTHALSIALVYVLASIGVGIFLLRSVSQIVQIAVESESYFWKLPGNIEWMNQLAICYGGLAVVVLAGYVIAILLIHDRLSGYLTRLLGAVPWIGSTVRMVSMGELCQSIYQSVRAGKTYDVAFRKASTELRNPSLRRWSGRMAAAIESGVSLVNLLRGSSIRDQPIGVLSGIFTHEISETDAIQVWHHAAAECHLLADSRLNRTLMATSVTCVLVSVLIAAVALLSSTMFLQIMVRGFIY